MFIIVQAHHEREKGIPTLPFSTTGPFFHAPVPHPYL
jgi:hypothetical protein